MSFQHDYPYGDVHEMNLDWLIQTMQEFINSERAAGNTPTVASVRSYFTHKYPYGDIHELNLDWVIQTALRMEEIGDSVEGDIGELHTRMTTAETNITVLDNSVTGLNESVDQIETEIGNINADVDAVETTTAQHTTQISALDAKIDSQVVANPAGAATDTLDTIEIAGTVYGVEESGGSEVEANPTGEPTDTLEKIGIDGTIYEVGGGSVEPVSKTTTGNPIHIEDAADAPIVSGEVVFEPIQDLHGYDKPWAGGAGKNLLMPLSSDKTVYGISVHQNSDGSLTLNGTAESGLIPITRSFRVIANTDYAISIGNYDESVISDFGLKGFSNNKIINNNVNFTSDGIQIITTVGTVFNNVIVWPQIELGTQATTFEPYSNICPIEGYADCELEVTRKNLFSGSFEVGAIYAAENNHQTYENRKASINTRFRVVTLLNVDAEQVTISCNFSTYEMILQPYNEDEYTVFPVNSPFNVWLSEVTTITGIYKLAIALRRKDGTVITSTDFDKCKLQVEHGSTVTPFEPYQSTTYTIDLDGTRYGGTVYPVTGKMSDNMGHIASYAGETIGEPWLSDRDEYVAGTTPTTGAEVVYTLASPTIVQLTPEQIRTLEGTNNISTNMTSMSLEYITEEYQPLVELIEQSAGHHYSTQERVVGTWIDGKPLYEKVVDFGALPNATTKDLNHNIADIDTVFIVGGYAKNTTSGFVQQLNVPVPSNNQAEMLSQWYFGVTATYIRCFTLADRTSYDECKVILQYTKTTD